MKSTMTKPCSRWSRKGAALLLLGACLASGCGALSSKGEALTPRFFSPTPLETPPAGAAPAEGAARGRPEGAVRARLSLLITLRDERHALLERTVNVEVPVGSSEDPGPALASAMAVALGQ